MKNHHGVIMVHQMIPRPSNQVCSIHSNICGISFTSVAESVSCSRRFLRNQGTRRHCQACHWRKYADFFFGSKHFQGICESNLNIGSVIITRHLMNMGCKTHGLWKQPPKRANNVPQKAGRIFTNTCPVPLKDCCISDSSQDCCDPCNLYMMG